MADNRETGMHTRKGSGGRRCGVFALLFLCAPAFAGLFTVGPDYHGPPGTETPGAYKNGGKSAWKRAAPSDAQSRAEWWKVFRDPVLDRVEERAVVANQNIAMAVNRIQELRAEVRLVAAQFLPSLELEPNGIRERTPEHLPFQRGGLIGNNPLSAAAGSATSGAAAGGKSAAGGTASSSSSSSSSSGPVVLDTQPLSRTYNLFNFPANLNWELDLFGRVRRSREAAKATAQAAAADFQNTMLSVTANVAGTYFQIRALDEEIGVLERTIASRKEGLQIAQERLSAGLTSELNVTQAEAELAGNEASLAGVRRSRLEMENALATLLGYPASDFSLIRRPLIEALMPGIPAGLPSALLERRPDIATAERQLAAANANIGVATAAFFPVVKLTGAAGFESADLGDLFGWENRVWQIGPSITLPIFEGGKNIANLNIAQARYREQIAGYRQQVLIAFQDVENALGDLRTLTEQEEAQGRAVAAANRALQLSEDQYDKGAADFLNVLDSERTLLADEQTAVEITGQRFLATVALIKALGGGW